MCSAVWVYAAVCWSVVMCDAVWCSVLNVLQCIAVDLQCVAVCWSVLQCVGVCCSVLQCIAACCSVLQCIAACCSVLQCAALYCRVLQYVKLCFGVLQRENVYKSWCGCTNLIGIHSSFAVCCSVKMFTRVRSISTRWFLYQVIARVRSISTKLF